MFILPSHHDWLDLNILSIVHLAPEWALDEVRPIKSDLRLCLVLSAPASLFPKMGNFPFNVCHGLLTRT
jgi:hypothetical protein